MSIPSELNVLTGFIIGVNKLNKVKYAGNTELIAFTERQILQIVVDESENGGLKSHCKKT